MENEPKWFFPGMGANVSSEVSSLTEGFAALVAAVRFLAAVRPQMRFERARPSVRFPANSAQIGLRSVLVGRGRVLPAAVLAAGASLWLAPDGAYVWQGLGSEIRGEGIRGRWGEILRAQQTRRLAINWWRTCAAVPWNLEFKFSVLCACGKFLVARTTG